MGYLGNIGETATVGEKNLTIPHWYPVKQIQFLI